MSAFPCLKAVTGARSTWLLVGALLASCVSFSCNRRTAPQVARDVEDAHAATASTQDAAPTLASLSLAQLRKKLSSLKGKVVVVDLWALW